VIPGTRVRLTRRIATAPAGTEGTVDDRALPLLNGFDMAVRFDDGITRCVDRDEVEAVEP